MEDEQMTYSPQSGNKGPGDTVGTPNTPRKVYRSKMTDAYAIDELGEEMKPVEPEEYFEDAAIYLLAEINLIFEKIIHTYFTPHGLTHVQIPILMTLLKEGSMTVSQLGRSLEIGSSNITPLCKRLETMNLVTRKRDHYDQRVVFVTITDYARDLLMQINREIKSQIGSEFDPMSSEDEETIQRGLTLFRDYLANIMASAEKSRQVGLESDKRKTRLEQARLATELSESKRESKKRDRPRQVPEEDTTNE